MFEFSTKSGNKIKIINVTEARGNFATILSDTTSHYIITKNNKPLRVIINYADFQTLQELLGDSTPDITGEDVDTESARGKRGKTPAMLKGILAEQIELSQQSEPVLLAPEESGEFSLENVPALLPEIASPTTENERLTVTENNFLEGEADYFQNDGGGAETLDKILPEPESILENQEAPKNKAGEEIVQPERTPEEQAYFERFRKLYENHPASEDLIFESKRAEEFEKEITLPEHSEPSHDSLESEFLKHLPVDKPEVSNEEAETRQWDDSFATSALTEEERKRLNEPTQERGGFSEPEAVSEEGLPSLQQLLKDLEGERLSGEESESLDADDIDEINNRITSD
jgi:prevent-host-death family protein